MKKLALAVLLAACAPSAPAPAPAPVSAPVVPDHPPADLQTETLVRCLIDTPDGCTGCDAGDTCVYKQMKAYDCVYIVYGTKCEN
jgi:hypothetical protein